MENTWLKPKIVDFKLSVPFTVRHSSPRSYRAVSFRQNKSIAMMRLFVEDCVVKAEEEMTV